MAIKIIDGKAVVVPDDSSGSTPVPTPQPSIPRPSSQQTNGRMFSQQDQGVAKDFLKGLLGLIPGAQEVQTAYSPTSTPQQRTEATQSLTNPLGILGKYGVNIARGIGGGMAQLGLSLGDIFANRFNQGSTPITSANTYEKIPLLGGLINKAIGPQQSIQTGERQMLNSGVSPVLAGGLSVVQTIMDALGAKYGLKTIGKAVEPKISPTNLTTDLLQTLQKEKPVVQGNIPQEGTFNSLPPKMIEKAGLQVPEKPVPLPPPAPEYKPVTGPAVFFDRAFGNMDARVGRMGEAGRELSNRYNFAEAKSGLLRGPAAIQIDKMPKLNPKQQSEFVAATEQNVPSADPKVMQAVSISRQLAADFQSKGNQAGILIDDSTGLPIGDPTTYFPHMLNEAGAEALRNKPNTFFKDMATANNMDEASFRNVWDRFISPNKEQVAGFERQRQFQIPDQYLEKNPQVAWHKYNHEFSRRVAFAEEFGKNNEIAQQLAGKIGVETGDPYNTHFANKFVDIATGRVPKDWAMENLTSNLVKRAVYSKLGPVAATANLQQGYLVNTNFFGPSYAMKGFLSTFTPEGKAWARKTGVIGEGFYTDYSKTNAVWNKVSGFPLSEDLNFIQVANGAKYAAQDLYSKLVKNPADQMAAAKLDFLGVKDWRKTLTSGASQLSDEQLGRASLTAVHNGVFPKLAAKIPEWTTGGGGQGAIGRATYLFNHYQIQQPKFLMSQFKFGKMAGIKALASTMLTAGILGELPSDLASLTRGEQRTKNGLLRFLENALTVSPAGLPYQMTKTAAKYGGYGLSLMPLGSAAVGGPLEAGGTLTKDILKTPEKIPEDLLRQYVKGNIPFGPVIPGGATLENLFPKKKK